MVNVGKHTSPMVSLGNEQTARSQKLFKECCFKTEMIIFPIAGSKKGVMNGVQNSSIYTWHILG